MPSDRSDNEMEFPTVQSILASDPFVDDHLPTERLQSLFLKRKICSNSPFSSPKRYCEAVDERPMTSGTTPGDSEPFPNPLEDIVLSMNTTQSVREFTSAALERNTSIEIVKDDDEQTRLDQLRKQRQYNGKHIDAYHQRQEVQFELVLESDPHTLEPIIEVPLSLVLEMKSHQINGVRFLWNRLFANGVTNSTQQDGAGAILAHCMGLGKTFTSIVLLHTVFRYSHLTHIKRVLILCPLNTAINWKNEFDHWLNDLLPAIPVYLLNADEVRTKDRRRFLQQWYETGGVLLMGYELYRLLTYTDEDNPYECFRRSEKKPKKLLSDTELSNINECRRYLRSPGPDLIVCDEGHIIKNPKSGITCSLNKIDTRRRVVLTGTPMQNNLKEYFAMIDFCQPGFLGTRSQFMDRYCQPIEAGQHRDSSKRGVNLMRRCIYTLRERVKPLIDRQGLDVLSTFLPPKFEYAINIRCRPLQRQLYETFIRKEQNPLTDTRLSLTKLFADYQYLMKIWTHPWLLRPHFLERHKKTFRLEDEQKETEAMIRDEFTINAEGMADSPAVHPVSSPLPGGDIDGTTMNAMRATWWHPIFDPAQSRFDLDLSGKFVIFKAILDECQSVGDKLLVFARSLMTVDYIEACLAHWSEKSANESWQKGIDYFRIDGSVAIKQRAADVQSFNDANNSRGRLFLISTQSGGIGVNLFAANRVIILDTSWNPAHDLQAMFRSYRLGQCKPVYIYRLIVKGTMEEKIYKRQITKQAMFHRVVDAKQLARHFTYDELAQLYESDFDREDESMSQSDTGAVQDQLLKNLLANFSETIVSYREHDSFLIHNDQEDLTAEERQQAKDEADNPSRRSDRRREIFSDLLDHTTSTVSDSSKKMDYSTIVEHLFEGFAFCPTSE